MKPGILFLRRALAYLADGVLVFFVAQIVLTTPKVWFGEISSGTYAWLRLVQALLGAAYFIVGHWRYGRTVGKAIVGLRVVTEDLKSLSLAQAALRYTPFLVCALGFVWIDARGWEPTRVVIGKEEIDLWSIIFGFWIAAEMVTSAITGGQRSIHDFLSRTWVRDANAA